LSSLKAFLRDYVQFDYSVPEIVEHYVEWVNDVRYMILSRWNQKEWKNDVFAVKCAKRGNDVYRYRVYRRFKGLTSKAGDLVFFNSKDRGSKNTRALWVTLNMILNVARSKKLGVTSEPSSIVLQPMFAKSLAR